MFCEPGRVEARKSRVEKKKFFSPSRPGRDFFLKKSRQNIKKFPGEKKISERFGGATRGNARRTIEAHFCLAKAPNSPFLINSRGLRCILGVIVLIGEILSLIPG